jgi:probable rRNA maturation factor
MAPGPRLQVVAADDRGRSLARPALTRWLARVAPARARGQVTIALVSDARVRALNRQYRRVDRPTDVLSFPSDTANGRGAGLPPSPRLRRTAVALAEAGQACDDGFLGDIVIARGVARRQAREAQHSELAELRVLALHGLLHLLGYDHHDDDGRMRRLEGRLGRKGGLRLALIDRAAGKQAPAALASANARASGAGVGPRARKK